MLYFTELKLAYEFKNIDEGLMRAQRYEWKRDLVRTANAIRSII